MQSYPVHFRAMAGVSQIKSKLQAGELLVQPAQECNATKMEDKVRILECIRESPGGLASFDEFLNCMVELKYAVFRRLPSVTGTAAESLLRMHQLHAVCHLNSITSMCELGMGVSWEKLTGPRILMNIKS